jgi:hypothetical protein
MSQVEILVALLKRPKIATVTNIRLKALVIQKLSKLLDMSFTDVLDSAGNEIEWFNQQAQRVAAQKEVSNG